MNVIDQKPVPIAEVKNFIPDFEEKKELEVYLKKFVKLKKEKSEELAKEIQSLNNMKINERGIVKIVDFLPKDAEEVNKIFTDVTLTEEESNAIVEIVKKY